MQISWIAEPRDIEVGLYPMMLATMWTRSTTSVDKIYINHGSQILCRSSATFMEKVCKLTTKHVSFILFNISGEHAQCLPIRFAG